MHRYTTAPLALTIALAAALGCNKSDDQNKPSPSSSGSAATLAPTAPTTTAAAGTREERMPAWYAQVPQHAVSAKPGDKVWAIVPFSLDSEATRATVVEVVSVEGNTATVRDLAMTATGAQAYQHRTDVEARSMKGIPGLLMAQARTVDQVKPSKNDIVFAFKTNAPNPPLAKVKSVADGLATYDVANANADKVSEDKTDIVEPYGHGVGPFTYAAVSMNGVTSLMFVMATDGDTVYGKSLTGTLIKAKKSDCKSVSPSTKDRKSGDSVVAFPFGGNMVEGKIDKVRVPGQIYELNGRPVTWDFVYDKI
jgi:hypothetical protein